jgi:proteasome lid subunit RPN8/RPN11
VRIDRAALEAVRAHGAEGYPREICGILLGPPGKGRVTEVRRAGNIIGRPDSRWPWTSERARDRYEMDPADQIRVQREADAAGLDVVGYYHSHPDHPAKASKFDEEQAWAGYVYLIVAIEQGIPVDANAFVAVQDHGPFRPEPLESV